jgi:hypothetical protein
MKKKEKKRASTTNKSDKTAKVHEIGMRKQK